MCPVSPTDTTERERNALYFQHKIKCLRCQLHFVVASWKEDWELGEASIVYCPECGDIGEKLRFAPVKVDEEIYEFVPGPTALDAGTPVIT